jgi:multiple sugar transport system substrate-binding protein
MTRTTRKLSDHELSRVIDFLRKIRQPFDAGIPGAKPDIYWNVVLELVDSYLQQRNVDMSALIELSQATWGTGNRLVTRMIEDGLIERVPRGPKHKTAFLVPSERLLGDFIDYSAKVKAHLAKTFGLRSGSETEEYYFGGSYFAAHIIAPLQGGDISSVALRNLRFLLHDDNYFASMRNMWSDFRNDIGRKSSFDLRPLPDLYAQAEIALNDPATAYDVVAVNLPWLGRFADAGLLAPLDDVLPQAHINPLDFHPSIWGTGRWSGRQYGIPIYCTVEILTARRDLFEGAHLAYPRTFDETIAAARALHKPEREQYGISWNGARGMTIAHAFMFFMASSQGSVIDIPRKTENWLDGFDTRNLRLRIDSEEGLAALDYMRRLAEVSPPGVEMFGADRNLECFMSGHAAMSYAWTMRAARLEYELSSKVKRRVAYLTPPVLKGRQVTAPVGGLPANDPRLRDGRPEARDRERDRLDGLARSYEGTCEERLPGRTALLRLRRSRGARVLAYRQFRGPDGPAKRTEHRVSAAGAGIRANRAYSRQRGVCCGFRGQGAEARTGRCRGRGLSLPPRAAGARDTGRLITPPPLPPGRGRWSRPLPRSGSACPERRTDTSATGRGMR